NVRAPSPSQIRLAQAVLEGFLLGYGSWYLWQHVGNAARVGVEHDTLGLWRSELAKRYPAITRFHDTLTSGYFLRPVNTSGEGHLQFDSTAHRSYLDHELGKLTDCVSMLAAMAIEETGSLVARFGDSLLVEGTSVDAGERIAEKLAAAFGGYSFNVAVTEV